MRPARMLNGYIRYKIETGIITGKPVVTIGSNGKVYE